MTQREIAIAEWLTALAIRCVPKSRESLEVTVRDYAQGFAEMPYEAFTTASREAASQHFEWFPSYKALRSFLEKWCQEHKPPTALPAPDEPTLTDDDRLYLLIWQRRRAGNTKNPIEDFAKSLDTMRSLHPALIPYLARTDGEVLRIAKQRGWLPELRIVPNRMAAD